jgi:hypothetical protein
MVVNCHDRIVGEDNTGMEGSYSWSIETPPLYYGFFLDVRVKTKTEPLCPLVIRIASSIYVVLSQPVGPKTPNGKVISNGDLGTRRRHESNLTSMRRLSSEFGWNLTSTVRDTRRSRAGTLTVTKFRTRCFCRSTD